MVHNIYNCYGNIKVNQENTDGIVMRLRAGKMRNCGTIPSRFKRYFSSPQHPDLIWGIKLIIHLI
jgi:hypothetical protein